MTPEEAAQLLGENLVSSIITGGGQQTEEQCRENSELVFVTADSTQKGAGESAQEVQAQELNEQPISHHVPMMTSEEQAVANTLAYLAQ